MAENDFGRAPAGWYPDPLGLPQMRWWDNIGWTQDVAEARQPMVMRENNEARFAWADDELPPRRERREQRRREREAEKHGTVDRWRPTTQTLLQLEPPRRNNGSVVAPDAADTAEDEPSFARRPAPHTAEPREATPRVEADPDFAHFFDWPDEPEPVPEFAAFATSQPAFAHAPASAFRSGILWTPPPEPAPATARTDAAAPSAAAGITVLPRVISTGPVWIIALLPVAQLVLGLLFVSGFGLGGGFAIIAVAWLSMYVMVIVLAICDRRILERAGHARPAHWLWAILGTPVYLIARAGSVSRESGRGFAPLVTWAVLAVVQIGSVIAVPGLLISALPAVFSAQVEQSVMSDASALGVHANVHCPIIPPTLIGGDFGCTALMDSGRTTTITVSLQRLNGWIDWRVDDWGIWTLNR